jgi:hypothetical protein
MKLNQALKTKNRLAAEIARLKTQIVEQNNRSAQQPFDYDTRELVQQLRARIDELARIKGAIGKANGEIYERIFRLAELRGAIITLKQVPTRHGIFLQAEGFSQAKEVEYKAQMRQTDVDKLVLEFETQIHELQDELDRFNQQCEVDVEKN